MCEVRKNSPSEHHHHHFSPLPSSLHSLIVTFWLLNFFTDSLSFKLWEICSIRLSNFEGKEWVFEELLLLWEQMAGVFLLYGQRNKKEGKENLFCTWKQRKKKKVTTTLNHLSPFSSFEWKRRNLRKLQESEEWKGHPVNNNLSAFLNLIYSLQRSGKLEKVKGWEERIKSWKWGNEIEEERERERELSTPWIFWLSSLSSIPSPRLKKFKQWKKKNPSHFPSLSLSLWQHFHLFWLMERKQPFFLHTIFWSLNSSPYCWKFSISLKTSFNFVSPEVFSSLIFSFLSSGPLLHFTFSFQVHEEERVEWLPYVAHLVLLIPSLFTHFHCLEMNIWARGWEGTRRKNTNQKPVFSSS